MSTQTVRNALRNAVALLEHCTPSPRTDAELLMLHALQWSRSRLFTHAEVMLDSNQQSAIEDLLRRRIAGEPVAYITGTRGFWTLDLAIDPRVLIPRPETELLIERALQRCSPDRPLAAADLGTGSGAIALALASECPAWTVTATDRSADALAVARANGERLGLKVDWRQGEWFDPLAGLRFGLLLANPPYIAEDDLHLSQGDVRFEPRTALAAGQTGLDDLSRIIHAAPEHLEPGGWLILEHGYDQAAAVADMMQIRGFEQVSGFRDLAGQPRVTQGRRK